MLVGYRGAPPASIPVERDAWSDAGPLGGLATALVTAATDRVLVLACDLPYVTTPFLAFLADVDPDAAAVVPVCDGRWQPLCAIYARSAADTFVTALARGDRAVVPVVSQLRPRLVGREEWARFDRTGLLLANVNTPDDLARIRSREVDTPIASADAGNAADRTAGSEASQTKTR